MTVYDDCIQLCGGEDLDAVLLEVKGHYEREAIADDLGVSPEYIEVSDLGPLPDDDLEIIEGRGMEL